MKILSLLVMNVVLALVWGISQGTQSALGYAIGFLFGYLALTVLQPDYGRRTRRALGFVFYVLWQIFLSALTVARALVTPGRTITPGIVAVPLEATNNAEIVLLASVITLTPGTISVATGHDAAGRRVLFVHALLLDDPVALRDSIKRDFERRILAFSRAQPPAALTSGDPAA